VCVPSFYQKLFRCFRTSQGQSFRFCQTPRNFDEHTLSTAGTYAEWSWRRKRKPWQISFWEESGYLQCEANLGCKNHSLIHFDKWDIEALQLLTIFFICRNIQITILGLLKSKKSTFPLVILKGLMVSTNRQRNSGWRIRQLEGMKRNTLSMPQQYEWVLG